MAKKKITYATITEEAEALLTEVSYVDLWGREVGLTYTAILARLHADFPKARTSLGSLRKIAYALNGSKQRMPVRRRSAKILARDYARALLVQEDQGVGLPFGRISRRVRQKFPMHPISARQLKSIAVYIPPKFKLPLRPEG